MVFELRGWNQYLLGRRGKGNFLRKLAYLSDVSETEWTKSADTGHQHKPPTRNLEMWEQRLKGGIETHLRAWNHSLRTTSCRTRWSHVWKATSLLSRRYFPEQDPAESDRICEPFSTAPAADFSTAEEEQIIDVTSDSTMRHWLHSGLEWKRTSHC